MSFIEDHKTWILPLLGLGAVAVIWLNVRAFSPQSPTVQEPLPPIEAAQAPLAHADIQPIPGSGESIWDDLRPVAFVPSDLEAHAAFEKKALSSLPPEAFSAPDAPTVLRPSAPEPSRNAQKARVPDEVARVPAPPPDFLIDGPGGPQAWFEGHGYRTGQPMKGHPFTVQSIRILPTPRVTLQGPSGPATRSTRPTPVQEVP
jgi:hypothetical protein